MERPLESVVLNEGLEKLGECTSDGKDYNKGVFCYTRIKRITLPSTLRVLGDGAFYGCNRLKRVTFAEGSQLEQIGPHCFSSTAIEEFQAPPSLREIGCEAFSSCSSLE